MITIPIKYSDIPPYLHAGEFYRSLDSEDPEGIIEVPADCFHPDGLKAVDMKEFRQLLRVMVFWVIDEIPLGIMDFCGRYHVDVWGKGIGDLPDAPKQEVQSLLLTAYPKPETIPFRDIIEIGRWDLIIHAVSRIPKNNPATTIAAQCGNLQLLEYLHEDGFEWGEGTCSTASDGGYLDCLRYAHENGCPWNSETTKYAAQEGHLNCLEYAHENGCPWNNNSYLVAAYNGHLNCMMYAFSQGLEWHVDVCYYAALHGQLSCLQFAHENGCPWESKTTKFAAQNGHVHCLMYALEHGCPVEAAASESACKNGRLECLQLLHQFGAPWDEGVPFYAAVCPTTDCLQYLHENGCPWDKNTPLQAAIKGHIEPLRYALEHGCPHHDELALLVQYAARGNDMDCLQYTVEDQLLKMDAGVFMSALLRGDLACLQYLLDQGCPYIDGIFAGVAEQWEIFDEIFRKDNPEFAICVEFAVERGWVPCRNFIRYIVTRDEPCKQWLISEGHYSEGGDGLLSVGGSSDPGVGDNGSASRVDRSSNASRVVNSSGAYGDDGDSGAIGDDGSSDTSGIDDSSCPSSVDDGRSAIASDGRVGQVVLMAIVVQVLLVIVMKVKR